MTIVKRGNNYHLRKRVPRRYQDVDERKSVWVSLHMDSLSVAQQKAHAAWQHIVEGWEARLAGDTSDAEKRFEAAKNLAAVRGFRYLPVDCVAELPQDDLLARVGAVKERKDGRPDMRDANAIMGGVSALVLPRFSSGLFRAIFAMKEIKNGNEIHGRVSP